MKEPKLKLQLKEMVRHYCGDAIGNAEKACVMAGYSERYARGNAHKLVKRQDFQEYLKYINELKEEEYVKEQKRKIATIADIQEFWSAVMNSGAEETKNRLKASELLAKCQGGFNNDW